MISQWLVTNLPSWLLLLGMIILIAGGAVLIQTFVRRKFPSLKGEEHNDVIKFAFGVIGFVFAFFLGFAIRLGILLTETGCCGGISNAGLNLLTREVGLSVRSAPRAR